MNTTAGVRGPAASMQPNLGSQFRGLDCAIGNRLKRGHVLPMIGSGQALASNMVWMLKKPKLCGLKVKWTRGLDAAAAMLNSSAA